MKEMLPVFCKNNERTIEVESGSTLAEVYAVSGVTLPNGPTSARVNNVVEGLNFKLYHAMDVEFLGKVTGTIFQAIYPVNSVCFTCADADPAQLFGGSWELLHSSDAMTAWRRTA